MDPIDYYNQNAKKYYDSTVELRMEKMLNRFIALLPENAAVLDLGCGSGRDSLYLTEQGFDVTALDGSKELCELAEIHIGQDILNIKFEEIDFDHVFDGIWACASLNHVKENEFHNILQKVVNSLKKGGILYMSFHLGSFKGYRGDRYYLDFTARELEEAVRAAGGLEIIELLITDDIRINKEQEWINIYLRKAL